MVQPYARAQCVAMIRHAESNEPNDGSVRLLHGGGFLGWSPRSADSANVSPFRVREQFLNRPQATENAAGQRDRILWDVNIWRANHHVVARGRGLVRARRDCCATSQPRDVTLSSSDEDMRK